MAMNVFRCSFCLRTSIENLILLCEPCHYWVHSKANSKKEFIDDAS